MTSYMEKTMLTLLLCLFVGNSTLRVIANEPSFCDKALICKLCMWQSCTDEKYKEWFGLMCCDSEAAQHTECRQLCENSSLQGLIRYNPYTNKSEKLCPTYHILYECEISRYCVEGMCTHPVESEVFTQQCLSKLGYEQLVTPKCKKLALRYYRSTMSSPKLVNATANSNEGPPDNRTIINSAGIRTTTLLAVDVFKTITPTPAYPAATQHVIVGLKLLLVTIAVVGAVCCLVVGAVYCWRMRPATSDDKLCVPEMACMQTIPLLPVPQNYNGNTNPTHEENDLSANTHNSPDRHGMGSIIAQESHSEGSPNAHESHSMGSQGVDSLTIHNSQNVDSHTVNIPNNTNNDQGFFSISKKETMPNLDSPPKCEGDEEGLGLCTPQPNLYGK